ncbi:MAG: VWA domain-containing protein [Kiritimatiellae bacterium]|nr:VWA domain-containing protein [Kiritimatiellia bacterium]
MSNENDREKTENGGVPEDRNTECTELVFVLDRSGSMHGMERAVIDGFNRLVEKQRRLPGRALVSVELFNNRFDTVYDRVDLERVRPLTEWEYRTYGCTALLDAVGLAIRHVSRAQGRDWPEARPGNTLFVINTDGYENASREFSREQIRRMVEEQEREHGWEFLFLGADIDSYREAGALGIRPEMTCNVVADVLGMAANFASVSEAASSLRSKGFAGSEWRGIVDRDWAARRGGG